MCQRLGPVTKRSSNKHGDAVAAPQQADLADGPLFEQLLDLAVGGVVAHLERHHEGDAGRRSRGGHAVAVLQGQRHGFLAQDVLARACRCLHHLGVAVGFTGDDHALDGGIVEQVLQVRRVAHAVLLGGCATPSGVVVPSCHQLHVVVGGEALAV